MAKPGPRKIGHRRYVVLSYRAERQIESIPAHELGVPPITQGQTAAKIRALVDLGLEAYERRSAVDWRGTEADEVA